MPVVGFVVKAVDGGAGNLDQHGSVHTGNSNVLDKDCTKTWSEPVRFTPSSRVLSCACIGVVLQ
jgi:hypothetical protein